MQDNNPYLSLAIV